MKYVFLGAGRPNCASRVAVQDETSTTVDTMPMRIAFVHDYLTQFGGAEQVLAVLAETWPDAPILTSMYDPEVQIPGVRNDQIRESSLGRIGAFRKNHRLATPFYPLAMRELGQHLSDIDIIVADSSAWSHQIPVSSSQALIVYCHSPARFLYGDPDYLGATNIRGLKARAISAGFLPFRWLDRRAWRRADLVVANSAVVARRLKGSVGVSADVLYPPIDTAFFKPASEVVREPFLLVVSRLVPHKAIDLIVRTATEHAVPLKVIGVGREKPRLESIAGPTVEFLGFQSRESVRDHLQRCQAFVLPGAEDFGMTAVEAQAAGAPVIAFNRGGATESVQYGKTGLLFDEQTVASLIEAIRALESKDIRPADCIANALQFDTGAFVAAMKDAVAEVAERRGIR